jgi:HAD superfamily hydrolase (TIGR01509 family)
MLDISRIQAITLDLDDTLWPVWPTIHRAEERLQQWLQPHAPATAALFADAPLRNQLRAQVMQQWPLHHHDLSHIRLEMIRLGLRNGGEDTALAEPAFGVFFAARQEVVLFDDAEGALRALSSRWPILALSNGNADVHRIGIGAYFCGSVSARDAGVAKPDARIFQAASDALKLPPEAVLHVGDDADLDVVGALGAGMQTAWVNRNDHTWNHQVQPHTTVATMAQLCQVLGL